MYEATKAQLEDVGLTRKDATRLFKALATLADYEGFVKRALIVRGFDESAHSKVCAALRYLVDGDGCE